MARIALFVFLMLGAVGAVADACPPGPCLKYRRPVPDVVTAIANGYTAQGRAHMPRLTRASIAAFLTARVWEPIYAISANPHVETIAPPRVRFSLARNARPMRDGTRLVLLRRIEVRRNLALVEVDGGVFALEPCGEFRSPRVCLMQRADLDFDDEQITFSKPPPN
jgi:hypothetical protein